MLKSLLARIQFISPTIILLFIHLFFLPYKVQGVNLQREEKKGLPWTVQVMFGIRGPKPLVWDGRASMNKGQIEAIQSVNFTEKDKLFPLKNQWKCSIDRLGGSKIKDQLRGLSPREYFEERVAKGIILDLHAPRSAQVSIVSSGGVFSFSLADLSFGKPLERLGKNVKIQLVPRSFIFDPKERTDNYSAITMDNRDNIWVARIRFKKGKERLVLRKYDGNTWGKDIQISGKGCYLQPSLTGDYQDGIWACWPARIKGNWDIYARYFKNGRWSKTIRLTDHPAPDTNQRIFVDGNNRLWVCWQSFQFGNADIFMKYHERGQWSKVIRVTDHEGNDWQPALIVDNQGKVYVAWDAYRNRKHLILLRKFIGRGLLPEIEVISTDNYVAHASLAADEQGRVWIAWDESGKYWGFGENDEQRSIGISKFEAVETQIYYNKTPMEGRRGRYNSRKLGLVCYYGGKFYKTSGDFYAEMPATMKMYADLPELQIDSSGRLWVFFHHYIGKVPFYIHNKLMEIWKVYGAYYDGRIWSAPIEFAHTTWRNIFAASSCAGKQDGEIWITYAGDNRQTGSRKLDPASICVGVLNPEKIFPRNMDLVLWENQPKVITPVTYTEITPLPKKRYESTLGLEKYRLFWGTLHEQHDLRGRMSMDGFVVDAFKYALDDQQYDFLGVSDYAYRTPKWFDSENYALWEAKKATSIYSTKKDFLSFYVRGRSPYKRALGHSLQKRPIPKGMPVITVAYVKDFSDESFIDALENRRNYVATDWIVLDFTVEGHPMGEKFPGANPHPRMLCKIIGTDELEQVDIIRNAKCVYSSKNIKGKEADITFVDMELSGKDDYHYFVQVKQKDGAMAWTAPVCYHYRPSS